MSQSGTVTHAEAAIEGRQRRPLVRGTQGYDRFVGIMKIALTIAAVFFFVVTVIWPIFNTRESSFVISQEKLPMRSDRVRISNARYVGTDAIDRLFTITAARALQDRPSAPIIELEDMTAQLALEDDRNAIVHASTGRFITQAQLLEVEGTVSLTTTDGYRLDAGSAQIDLNTRIAQSFQPVTGTTPLGDFRAGSYRIDADRQIATFEQGVFIRITPRANIDQPAEQN